MSDSRWSSRCGATARVRRMPGCHAQPYEAEALTPTGFRELGSLRLGDPVIGCDGRPTQVLGIFPQGQKGVVRIRTRDGGSTLSCGDHLWSVSIRAVAKVARPPRWQVVNTFDMLSVIDRGPVGLVELPVMQACDLVAQEVPTDPYTLGRHLGDESPVGGANARFAGGRTAIATLSDSIPEMYLENSRSSRVSLLQGLLDSRAGSAVGTTTQFRSSSPALLADVQWLVRSLGGVAQPTSLSAGDLRLSLPSGLVPFRDPDKQALYEYRDRPLRIVESIEPAGSRDTLCIRVAAEDSLYVTDDFLVTHNTQ